MSEKYLSCQDRLLTMGHKAFRSTVHGEDNQVKESLDSKVEEAVDQIEAIRLKRSATNRF